MHRKCLITSYIEITTIHWANIFFISSWHRDTTLRLLSRVVLWYWARQNTHTPVNKQDVTNIISEWFRVIRPGYPPFAINLWPSIGNSWAVNNIPRLWFIFLYPSVFEGRYRDALLVFNTLSSSSLVSYRGMKMLNRFFESNLVSVQNNDKRFLVLWFVLKFLIKLFDDFDTNVLY